MIELQNLASIGYITKTHALKGELSVILDVDITYLSEGDFVMIETDGIIVPYKTNSIRAKNSGALLLLDGIENESDAKHFVGKTLYTDKCRLSEYIHSDEGDGDFAGDLVGYTISDSNGTFVGIVKDLELSTQNALFILESQDHRTIYIPIAEEFITNIDHHSQNIIMNLPEGLLDLNN